MTRGSKVAVIVLILAGAAFLVWSFLSRRGELARERESELPVKAPVRVVPSERGNLVILDKSALAKSEIRAEPLEETVSSGEVTAYGSVVDIQEFLDWLTSYAKAGGESGKSRAELEVLRREYLRKKMLHDDSRNVSDKALEAAEGAWRSAKAQARAAEEAQDNLQLLARQRWGGTIARWLAEGDGNLDRLIRQQAALIQIAVPAGTPLAAPPASIRVTGAGSLSTAAVLVSPSPRMMPNLQGLSYYYLASANGNRFLPCMSVTASFPVGARVKGVYIPNRAVVWWQGKAWIYLQRKTGEFERREIAAAHPMRDGWFVADGLSRSDEAVVSGAQLLLSEELRSRIRIGG